MKLIPLINTLALMTAWSAQAIELAIQPPTQTLPAGSPVEVSIDISGLGEGVSPSLGGFDLIFLYDPLILQFEAASFGDPVLGDQLGLLGQPGFTSADGSAPGAVALLEVSLNPPEELDSFQAGSFTLAVLNFSTLGPGISPLTLTVNGLADSLGDSLSATVNSARITVTGVPDYGTTGLLLSAGLVTCLAFGRFSPRGGKSAQYSFSR